MVASIETDKVTVEVRAPQEGVIVKVFAESGAEVNVGEPLFLLSPDTEGAVERSDESKTATPDVSSSSDAVEEKDGKKTDGGEGAAEKKSVYKEATESKHAASAAVKQQTSPSSSAAKPASPPSSSAASKPAASAGGATSASPPARSETRVKMTRMRLRIAQRLKEAQNTTAMLTTFQEVDMTALMALRSTHKEEFEKRHGIKLGFMSAFVKVQCSLS